VTTSAQLAIQPSPLSSGRSGPLRGEIRPPGDKSISHRALIFGAMTVGRSTIEGLLEGEDVLNTAECLRRLGAQIVRTGPGAWSVDGVGVGGFREPNQVLDHGNSGTGVRLMMGAVATTPIAVTFTGDASLNRRPMGRVLTPLSAFGCTFMAREGGLLPLTLKGSATPGPITHTLQVASAQVKSALLLAALNAPGISTVIEREPTRDHTERMLRHFGAELMIERLADGATAIRLTGQPEFKPQHVTVPADPSSAAFPLVAALLVPGSCVVARDVLLSPSRTGLYLTLQEMGAKITITNQRDAGGEILGDIEASYSELKGVDVPASRAPSMIDEYPILAVAASFATGRTLMNGLGELKVKESDRLAATANALSVCGANVETGEDSLSVEGQGPGGLPGGGRVQTHMDHRIAMAFLVAGLAAKDSIAVDDANMIATSFPAFVPMMNGLGASMRAPNR
jgi:3-phosphoshikimate 1-carboxyvinyltransferase